MIVREILQKPEWADKFDYFNDFRDTMNWLKRCEPSEQRDEAIRRLEEGNKSYEEFLARRMKGTC